MFFSDFVQFRRGMPVDKMDRECQNWYRCSKCIGMDTYGQCDPLSSLYGVYYDHYSTQFVCRDTNNECQMKVCECDVHFVNTILASSSIFNSYYSNSYGWKPQGNCKSNFLSHGPADQCCGEYPTRYPYNSENGERSCCGSK